MQLFKDPETFPSDEELKKALGQDVFSIYQKLFETLSQTEFGLSHEWRYYNDGKAWLCKVTDRKKTIFWLSVWEKFFKISFYFTEKTRSGISELNISTDVIRKFEQTAPVGKLIPLTLEIRNNNQSGDLLKIIQYKMKLK